MGFQCPDCGKAGGLGIRAVMELPPDARSDEISLQLLSCNGCGARTVGIYEESRRGAMGDESFDHYACRVSAESWSEIKTLIAACPRPRDARCDCESHRSLGLRDAGGRWSGLARFGPEGRYPMVR